jgi:hypothetical protein
VKYVVLVIVCLFATVFVAVLSVMTLGMDIALLRGIVMQVRATTWPTTQGHVIASDVAEQQSSEGTSYNAIVRYKYSVADRHYESNRIRYGFDFFGKRGARRAIKPFPRGSDVTVHFSPRDPSQAVLNTHLISGGDMFAGIFLVPFNLLMLLCWFGIYRVVRKRGISSPAGKAVQVIEEERGARVRLTQAAPLGMAGLWAAVAALIVMFVILMLFGGGDLMLPAMVGWAIVLYAARRGYRRTQSRFDTGWYDLIIDEAASTVTLPQSVKAYKGVVLPYDQLQRVEMQSTIGEDGESNRVRLRWNDGGNKSVVLLATNVRESAEGLANWLRKRLGLDAPDDKATSAAPPSKAGSSRD